jgi:hypothetical protein
VTSYGKSLRNWYLNHLMPNDHFSGRTAPLMYRCCIFYLFNRYTYWIFLTCCLLAIFSSSKCRLFHNATFFGSCIFQILYTGVLKFKIKFRRQRVNNVIFVIISIEILKVLHHVLNLNFTRIGWHQIVRFTFVTLTWEEGRKGHPCVMQNWTQTESLTLL